MNIKNNFNDAYQKIDDNIHYDKKQNNYIGTLPSV